ncbi:dTDP-4-amino-4,6-dideoxygalactose transaminase [Rhodobacter aestuarii]|uniref:dTDP-4-amino-4,6-dideoxygalactose transaminase n=1 Tax=Rhodobacter aestuarii TaxID=453582 RepID=A0A1N7P6Y2_9RHOB|nr:DegT/DnrJ/EryC1/StrS family aminotransferase [Rhodobacter aestuarii]PTV97630.1 dTDP-4-amino-4,6-dideoxygalactose transaminase [Rhodobacter aestuarii]SIT06344.1 dTDP-4-amino-4,6-dideoxygalactose transaminase [Rhodobacter aestuarii]
MDEIEVFTGNFTQQEPISEAGIAAALAVLQSGRLHRYNVAPGEMGETAALEVDFATYTGAAYCLAVASGGYAMGCALRALGVAPGDRVLTNAFTLAPVPGAIAALGAEPVFVEVTEDLVIDLDDLADKATSAGAKVLLLSHMRGHVCDMDRLMDIAEGAGLKVIEDCAHTMGAAWCGVPSGRHGVVGCYSTQTYKHMNSGEGGLLISDDPVVMAKMILLSGSYMLYDRHRAAPPPEVFEGLKYHTPNVSGRMDNLRAAILRPQIAELPQKITRWNALYRALEAGLSATPGLRIIPRPQEEAFVGSSFQFLLPDWTEPRILSLMARCAARGVELKWFGAEEPVAFTSRHESWRYVPAQLLPRTDRILAGLLDLRLPLTFSEVDAATIARILDQEIRRA